MRSIALTILGVWLVFAPAVVSGQDVGQTSGGTGSPYLGAAGCNAAMVTFVHKVQ